MTDVIILHGTMGSPEGNWFPWLKNELEKQNFNVYVPTFPTPENQSKDSWCAALREQAPIFGKDTILVGHSLGATMLLHILEMVKEPVKKSIFVSCVIDEIGNDEYDTLNKSFIKGNQYDWDAISANAGDRWLFHGADDPYVPTWHSDLIHHQIGGEFELIKNGGHLNAESGYLEFPKILEVILQTEPQHFEFQTQEDFLKSQKSS